MPSQGRVWSRAELRHVAAACARQGVLLVADEIWADWVLPEVAPAEGGHGVGPERGERGERFVPCSAVAPAEGCALITLGAPTKTWSLAGLHASYLIIPDEALRRRYLQRAEPAFLAYGSAFATTALLAAYTHGGPWLEAAKAHVARNVAYLVRFVREHVPGIAPLVRLAAARVLIVVLTKSLPRNNTMACRLVRYFSAPPAGRVLFYEQYDDC